MDVVKIEATLLQDRDATVVQRDQLRRDLGDIITAAADVATDDEHDPEGATIAYERSRTQALIEQADAHLADIAAALDKLNAGGYGVCENCGRPISPERLEARPAVRTCIDCAR